MPRLLVNIGTDGVTDWIGTPDGQRFNLGSVSILDLVSKTVPKGSVRHVLDKVNSTGEALASVDEDRLWAMLEPKRVRLSAISSMPPHKVELLQRKESTMPTLSDDIQAIERHVAALDQAAGKATNMTAGVQHLVHLANKISSNQTKSASYYGLGAPEVLEAEEKVAGLSFDTYEENVTLANQILATAEETVTKIDALVEAGRPFNAAKAKLDVHTVTKKVAGILKVDLTASWVRDDLTKLASKANEIHALFKDAK